MTDKNDRMVLLLIFLFILLSLPSIIVIKLTGLTIHELAQPNIPALLSIGAIASAVLFILSLIHRHDSIENTLPEPIENYVPKHEEHHKIHGAKLEKKSNHPHHEPVAHHHKKQHISPVIKTHVPLKEHSTEFLPQRMLDTFVKNAARHGATKRDVTIVLHRKGCSKTEIERHLHAAKFRKQSTEKPTYDDELEKIQQELANLHQKKN
ncbi:MAG TPA: hypothetical protein VJH88_04070 [Candidatus Nanoarchaeia archaeon]|nr:hypothetical protein [Candidatus Nanoarchaeia archaeon]